MVDSISVLTPKAHVAVTADNREARKSSEKMMLKKHLIEEYTEQEFLDLVSAIFQEGSSPSDKKRISLLAEFRRLVEHPEGTDLIYYSSTEHCTPHAVTRIIKEWLEQNGKPGFKLG